MTDRILLRGTECQVISCGACGVVHAIPSAKYDACREEGGYWTCPNGHSRGFREGLHEKQAVQRERDRLKQENARLTEEAFAADRKRILAERKLTEHQRRASAGTCPCCNRTFANMSRHMKTKHPNFAQDNVVKLEAKKA